MLQVRSKRGIPTSVFRKKVARFWRIHKCCAGCNPWGWGLPLESQHNVAGQRRRLAVCFLLFLFGAVRLGPSLRPKVDFLPIISSIIRVPWTSWYHGGSTNVDHNLSLKLFLSMGSQLNTIEILSDVAWVEIQIEPDWGEYRTGVKFVKISPEDTAKLKHFLLNLSQPPYNRWCMGKFNSSLTRVQPIF